MISPFLERTLTRDPERWYAPYFTVRVCPWRLFRLPEDRGLASPSSRSGGFGLRFGLGIDAGWFTVSGVDFPPAKLQTRERRLAPG